jgi:hypothetical protein
MNVDAAIRRYITLLINVSRIVSGQPVMFVEGSTDAAFYSSLGRTFNFGPVKALCKRFDEGILGYFGITDKSSLKQDLRRSSNKYFVPLAVGVSQSLGLKSFGLVDRDFDDNIFDIDPIIISDGRDLEATISYFVSGSLLNALYSKIQPTVYGSTISQEETEKILIEAVKKAFHLGLMTRFSYAYLKSSNGSYSESKKAYELKRLIVSIKDHGKKNSLISGSGFLPINECLGYSKIREGNDVSVERFFTDYYDWIGPKIGLSLAYDELVSIQDDMEEFLRSEAGANNNGVVDYYSVFESFGLGYQGSAWKNIDELAAAFVTGQVQPNQEEQLFELSMICRGHDIANFILEDDRIYRFFHDEYPGRDLESFLLETVKTQIGFNEFKSSNMISGFLSQYQKL